MVTKNYTQPSTNDVEYVLNLLDALYYAVKWGINRLPGENDRAFAKRIKLDSLVRNADDLEAAKALEELLFG